MVTTSKLLATGDQLVRNQFDEYTLPSNVYATQFNGSSQYLTIPNNSSFNFGTGDFTIECWIYTNSSATQRIISYNTGAVQPYDLLLVNTGSNVYVSFFDGTTDNTTGTNYVTQNQWVHIAVTRSGTSLRIFINGVLSGSASNSVNLTNSATMYIGRYAASAVQYFSGYISNLRIVKGTAVYTSAFTPPTSPLTNITNTSLLTCQNSTIIDNSVNNLTITNNGAVTTTNIFSTQYSGAFSGSQYLTTPSSTAFALGTGDFTVETWIYWTSTNSGSWIADFRQSGVANQTKPQLSIATDGSLKMYVGTTIVITSAASAISFNTWYHVAMVRSSGVSKIYINGSQVGSSYTDTNNYGTTAQDMVIGQVGDNRGYAFTYFYGNMSNYRVIKGSGLYTSNFTPPSAPLKFVPGTALLTLQSPTIVDNSTNGFTITNNGSIPVRSPITWKTAKKEYFDGTVQTFTDIDEYTLPFNSYAAQFDGSSNYLLTGSSTTGITSENFTVECWFNLRSLTWLMGNGQYAGTIINAAGSGALNNFSDGGIWIYIGGGTSNVPTYISLTSSGATNVGPTASATGLTINLNTWYHLAVSRSGTNFAIWLNGVKLTITTSNTSNNYQPGTISIGVLTHSNGYRSYLAGNISNLRIVKGSTVYDPTGGNITVPTSPLTAIGNTYLLTCQNQSIVDNSTNAATITNVNTVTTNNITPTFYSGLFNGSNQYLTVPSNTAFDFGTGDFTIECWVWTAAYTNTYGRMIVDARPTATNGVYWNFGLDNTGKPGLNLTNGGASYVSSVSVADSKWHHVAVTRQSGTIRMFVDGASVLTPVTGSETTGSSGLRIGMNAFAVIGGFAADTFWNGYISNLRIIKGTAVYTAAFNPITQQLTAIPGTSLLTLQSPTIIDNSSNALTITNNGTVTTQSPASFIKTKSKLFGSGSLQLSGNFDEYTIPNSSYAVKFNGSSQYLIAPTNAGFAFPSDFTIEGWFYKFTAWTNTMDLVQGNGTSGISFYSAVSTLRSGPNNISSYSLGSSTGIPTNTWVHIAFVRKSNSARIYVNGVPLAAAVTDSNSYAQTALYIGGGVDGYFDGYISNIRVVKGTALYDPALSSFTPPSSPLTIIPNTSLLTCQNPTIVDNSGSALTITNIGTATTTNIPSTFYSGLFNGSSQYLTGGGGSTALSLDADFTIEFWIYGNGGGFYRYMLSKLAAFTATNNISIAFRNGNSSNISIFRGNTVLFNGGPGVTDGVWYHIAVVRGSSSGTYKIFINGVGYNWASNDAGVWDYSTFTVMGNPNDGGSTLAQTATGGYLSNLRIVKGRALYTANFTPPTKQLEAVPGTSLLILQSPTIIDKSTYAFAITNNGTATVSNPIL